MPALDARQMDLRVNTSQHSSSSPSESEQSFVSAELENTSKVRRDIGQSAPARAPPPSSSPRRGAGPRGHRAALSEASISPVRHRKANGPTSLAPKDPAATPKPSLPDQLSPPVGSYFAAQPGSTGIEARSPAQRRPPASRSSHGIETLSGPPPALSTQRSYNAESPWRCPPPADLSATPRPPQQRTETDDSIDSVPQVARSSTHDRRYSEPSQPVNGTRPRSSAGRISTIAMTLQNDTDLLEEDEEPTLRMNGQRKVDRRHTGNGKQGDDQEPSQEDLFLDLARADSVIDDASEVISRSERRRSRLSTQPRSSHPSSSGRPSTSGAQFPSHQTKSFQSHDPSAQDSFQQSPALDSLASLRSEMARSRPYAASAHPMDERPRNRQRDLNGKAAFSSPVQDRTPESQGALGRRRSIQATSPGFATHSYKSSNLSQISKHSKYASQPFLEQSQPGEGTESTVSTTAASTVWDELDDMKSRIRQLELTGKLPPSSNAAISNVLGERPRTAGTTMTTLSSSPKRRQRQSTSPEMATIREPDIAEVHPLLHSALGRSKDIINAGTYQLLEATAADALTLAAITATAQATSNDRQLRRKADSMCRSLTELCLALAEETAESQSSGPRFLAGSRNGTPPAQRTEAVLDPRFSRAISEDPELRSSSRVMSRLEARRTSLLGSNFGFSPREPSQEPGTPTQSIVTPLASKPDRTSSVLRRRTDEDESKTTARRPPSRATTELGQMRPSPQTRISREYVSNHPLPNHSQRSPSVQSGLPTRKSYFTSTTSPVTPTNILPGNRKYLSGSTPPSSSDSARLAEARQRRLASLGQSNTGSNPRVGRFRQTESEQ